MYSCIIWRSQLFKFKLTKVSRISFFHLHHPLAILNQWTFQSASEFIYMKILSSTVFMPDWSAALFVFKRSSGVSFAGLHRGQPMTGDQCMADRGQIDLTSVFLLSLHCQMFIPFSVTDSGSVVYVCVCVWAFCPHVVSSKDWLWLWLIDCTELSVTGQRGEKKTGRRRRRGCILMVSLGNKQLAENEWDGLSLRADMKWWAVRVSFVFPH